MRGKAAADQLALASAQAQGVDRPGILHILKQRVNTLVTFATLASFGMNRRRPSMSDSLDVTGERIRSIVERIEHIEEEIKALNEGKKEILQEAKGEGYDIKVIKEIIRLRKQDKDERDEHESLLDLYLSAMESSGADQAKAA